MSRIRATDMPRVRDDLLNFWRGELAEVMAQKWADDGDMIAPPPNGAAFTGLVRRNLTLAELYYVSSDMTQLAVHAAQTTPRFVFERVDLPSDHGLIVFEEPFDQVSEDPSAPCPLIAALWGTAPAGLFPGAGGVWITVFADSDITVHRQVAIAGADAVARARNEGLIPPLTYNEDCAFAFGAAGEAVNGGSTRDYGTILRTAWLLMQQESIASSRRVEVDRAERRRLARRGIQPQAVRVITLRTAHSAGPGSAEAREYHHRWIVRGHWRNQWLPSRRVHRPIWIAPHLKGPEDAPLLTGEKVYAWTR